MTLDPSALLRPAARGATRRRDGLDAADAQRRTLAALLRRARHTRFGRAHGFERIASVAAFRDRVPLRDWDAFWTGWWAPDFPVLRDVSWPGTIPFFAETSGTTSRRTKHIPVSRDMIRSNRRAALLLAFDHLARRPGSRFFGGPSLLLGGSTALRTLPGGARSGDLSGIGSATIPFYAAPRTLPSPATALTADWDEKLRRVVQEACGAELRSISGTASWLLILFERLLHATGRDRLDRAFPLLELVVHGGVGFSPYRARFERLLGPSVDRTEVYAASEGFIAFGAAADGDALRLLLDNGLFFEFVPLAELGRPAPTRHWIADAETGTDYALALSTDAGLFAYLVGDTVRVVDRARGLVVVTGRTAQTLSAFGEHLSVGEIDRAVARVADALGVRAGEHAVAVVPPDSRDERGGHLFVVEADAPPDPAAFAAALPDPAGFAAALDAELARHNDDYRAHRAHDTGMRPPSVRFVRPLTFERWLRARGRVGGQVKVPRILPDDAALAALLAAEPGRD